jgi:hypothetical protein
MEEKKIEFVWSGEKEGTPFAEWRVKSPIGSARLVTSSRGVITAYIRVKEISAEIKNLEQKNMTTVVEETIKTFWLTAG